jgi:hypothetical protein
MHAASDTLRLLLPLYLEARMFIAEDHELDLAFHPLTPERWHDLEQLFGTRGACGGCWCMWWRVP